MRSFLNWGSFPLLSAPLHLFKDDNVRRNKKPVTSRGSKDSKFICQENIINVLKIKKSTD